MAVFRRRKTEEELQEWEIKLSEREAWLNHEESRLRDEDFAVEMGRKDYERGQELLGEKEKELEKRFGDLVMKEKVIFAEKLELTQLQENANADYIKQHQDAFQDAISLQMQQIERWRTELIDQRSKMNEELKELKELEGRLVADERRIKELQLDAANGFASLNQASLRQLEQREEDCKLFEQRLEERENALLENQRVLEVEKESLRQRRYQLTQDEEKRDAGYAELRSQLDQELATRRAACKEDLAELHRAHVEKLENERSEWLKARLDALDEKVQKAWQDFESQQASERASLAQKAEELRRREEQVEDLEFEKQRTLREQQHLQNELDQLSEKADRLAASRVTSLQRELETAHQEMESLRESIATSQSLIMNFKTLQQKLKGDDPARVLSQLQNYEREIRQLRNDLANRPGQEMRQAYTSLIKEKEAVEKAHDKVLKDNQRLLKDVNDTPGLRLSLAEKELEVVSLEQRYEALDALKNDLREKLDRFVKLNERSAEREERVKAIERVYAKRSDIEAPKDKETAEAYEIEWLEKIQKGCEDYGLVFPKRILYAFHTALKTSEWSPITVLAGVSGTGKSELPRLYSHFGGLNFLSLAVQPNWDSQESMLGFFNSIDNRFDAQPVLRFLAQSQKESSEDYPYGMRDAVNLVLMDEMNLAHVELYFAEFLSKLEARRGVRYSDAPALEVKLGTDMEAYQLPLGRNVLWTGTMNQDETTKSLSDKVLDRGTVIHFPRPVKLARREKLEHLPSAEPLLHKDTWNLWWQKESGFKDHQIAPYKSFVEEMNESLSVVGRAMGHRVWQSIEYYMANYPEVGLARREGDDDALKQAMKVAFEDQLVQKVMPKLRGIETRGKSKTDCLDNIRKQLVDGEYAILDDFDRAQSEVNYGQFIWNSAEYLSREEP